MTYRIDSVVIQLPSHDLVRVDRTNARGVCVDGVTWDGTMAFSPATLAAIDNVRARLFGEEVDR